MENLDLITLNDKPDKLTKFKQHLINEVKLTDSEKEQFDMYLQVDKYLTSMLSLNTVVRLISRDYGKSFPRAYQIVTETTQIFGDPFKSFSKGQKKYMYENYMTLAKKCMDNGKEETALNALDKASKLLGLYDPEPDEDIASLMNIKNRFTTNIEVLRKKQQEVQDIEFEDVNEARGQME